MPSTLSSFGSPALFADFSITSTASTFVDHPYDVGLDASSGRMNGITGASEQVPVEPAITGWTLDDLLGATLPDFDMSQYTNADPPSPVAPVPGSSGMGLGDLSVGLESARRQEEEGLTGAPRSPFFQAVDAASATLSSALALTASGAGESMKVGPLLETFCACFLLNIRLTPDDQYILGAWAVTYPSPVREGIIADYHRATNRHRLNRLCRQAAGASCTL